MLKVVGTEDARSDDGQEFRGGGMKVVEAMDGAARDDEGLTGAEFACVAVDGEGKRAFEPVCCFLVGVVAVGAGDFGAGTTSNSNMAMESAESRPSTRNRMASPPILISSRGLAVT